MPKGEEPIKEVQIRNKTYTIMAERLTPQEVRVSVKDAAGTEVIGTELYEFARSLSGVGSEPKGALSPDAMSINVEKDGYKLKVIFQNVNLSFGGNDAGANYDFFVLLGVPIE
jgi:hypothetical protein